MEKSIFKYVLRSDKTEILMPKNAEILTVQEQCGVGCIWALVNPLEEKEYRYFDIILTGQHFDSQIERKYIGTFQLDGGAMVYHLFERI